MEHSSNTSKEKFSIPYFLNAKYNGYLHTLERKLEHILENLERPNDELPRPAEYGIMGK